MKYLACSLFTTTSQTARNIYILRVSVVSAHALSL